MFLPPIIFTKFEKPRMLIFAFNCVSVLLIYIELLRYNGNILPQEVSLWFKRNSTGRERMADTMICTHIYLLMGCALPVTSTFILLSGGIYTSEWTVYSLAGIVFIGIGDSVAAIMGKKYGKTKWRELSSKT